MQLLFVYIADVSLIAGKLSSCWIYSIPELSRFGAALFIFELKIAMSSISNNYLSFVKKCLINFKSVGGANMPIHIDSP